MKKRFLKLTLALISCGILFNACKKETTISSQAAIDSKQIKDWYLQNVNKAESNLFSSMEPDWNKVFTSDQGNLVVFEITLNNPKKILLVREGIDQNGIESYADKNTIRLIIFKDRKSDKVTSAGYMSVLSDQARVSPNSIHYKQVGKLDGKILYYHINGDFNNGWQYNNGKIVSRISKGTEQGYLATKQMRANSNGSNKQFMSASGGGVSCSTETVDEYRTECVGYEGYMRCDRVKVGTNYLSHCADNDGGGSGGDGGSDGGFSGGSGGGSNGEEYGNTAVNNFIISNKTKANYPRFANLIKQLESFVTNDSKVLDALVKWSGLTKAQVLEKVKFGQGPLVEVKEMTGKFGYFNKAEDPNKFNISASWVRGLEAANLKETQEATAFLLGVTVLHEFVHQARAANGLDRNYEYGFGFEQSAFGLIIEPGDAYNYSYRLYQK